MNSYDKAFFSVVQSLQSPHTLNPALSYTLDDGYIDMYTNTVG